METYPLQTNDPALHKSIVVRSCPFCGNDELYLHKEPSRDGTITWHKIMHGPTTKCSVSMIDSDFEELLKRWNSRA